MALFDSVINDVKEKFGIGADKSGALVAALLGLIAQNGFGGFLDRFKNAGLGDTVSSWISTGDSTPLTGDQVESALGSDAVDSIASDSGVDRGTATSALGGIIPSIVDKLTPDGEVPDEQGLMSQIGGFLSGWGGAVSGAVAGGVGAAAGAASGAADRIGSAAGAVGSKVTGTANRVGDSIEGGGGSVLKWLLPLLLLGLLVLLGFWFCGRGTTPVGNVATNGNAGRGTVNANANRATTTNTNTNTNSNTSGTGAGDAAKTLSEVTLPNGTKLQAYPGGIEDQLVKFIGSDEYKNGTADTLKDKWFSFDDLNFVFGKTELTPESKRQFDNIVAVLKAFPDVKIKLGGYTDKKGDDAANLKLSDTRAKAVQAMLQKAGVGAQVPEAEGYGEQFATVAEDASDEARKVDRKTAVRLIK